MVDPVSSSSDPVVFGQRIRTLRRVAIGSLIVSAGALAVAMIAVLRAPVVPVAVTIAPDAATASPPPALPTKLDELTVGRLNIVEPDGTPRMIIASRARFPGSPVRGKDIPRPDRRDVAGILFVDDEGTENGGLVQNGKLATSGKVDAGLSLTFDRFRQDQALQLRLNEDGDDASAGIAVNDVPSYKVFSIDDLMRLSDQLHQLPPAEQKATVAREEALGHLGHRRGYFGTRKGESQLVLDDPQGRPRLTLRVSDRGEPSIALLDDTGKPVRTIDAHTR